MFFQHLITHKVGPEDTDSSISLGLNLESTGWSKGQIGGSGYSSHGQQPPPAYQQQQQSSSYRNITPPPQMGQALFGMQGTNSGFSYFPVYLELTWSKVENCFKPEKGTRLADIGRLTQA
jgi:hypothetical protein